MDEMFILKEACVGSFMEAKKSFELGANRIELCDNLKEGGTTPSAGTIKMAKKYLDIPVFVIINPRGGHVIYSQEEVELMKHDIDVCKSLGVDGVVIGALTQDKQLDVEIMKSLIERARGMEITFHMAFDFVKDKEATMDRLIDLGVGRILTRGGSGSAIDNLENLKHLVEYADNRITILPGGGVTEDNYMEIVNETGAREVHGTKIVGSLLDL